MALRIHTHCSSAPERSQHTTSHERESKFKEMILYPGRMTSAFEVNIGLVRHGNIILFLCRDGGSLLCER